VEGGCRVGGVQVGGACGVKGVPGDGRGNGAVVEGGGDGCRRTVMGLWRSTEWWGGSAAAGFIPLRALPQCCRVALRLCRGAVGRWLHAPCLQPPR